MARKENLEELGRKVKVAEIDAQNYQNKFDIFRSIFDDHSKKARTASLLMDLGPAYKTPFKGNLLITSDVSDRSMEIKITSEIANHNEMTFYENTLKSPMNASLEEMRDRNDDGIIKELAEMIKSGELHFEIPDY